MTARLLEWDSEFWGFRVGQGERATDDEWALANVDVMCLLVPAGATEELRRIEAANYLDEPSYYLVDVRVTLAQKPQWFPSPACLAENSDVDALTAIARTAHRDSRFYADPSFPVERCDDLYETWLRNSCDGYADEVFVTSSEPCGYCTVHLTSTYASIGLIAVSEEAQGWGRGHELVHAAVHYAYLAGAPEIRVSTQGRNIAAQRLFQSCGFRTTDVALWYHKDFR